MDKYQRHWKPHPGPPPRPEDDPSSLTPGVVQRLRAVTRARRVIWDKEARKWDMRFPLPEQRSKLAQMLQPIGGVKHHIADLQAAYKLKRRQLESQDHARIHEHEAGEQVALVQFDHLDEDAFGKNMAQNYSDYEMRQQLDLLAPSPSTKDLDIPTRLIQSTLTLQRMFRGFLTRKYIKASLTYEQLMRRSRLHRLAENRLACDARREKARKLGLALARLQAMFRGYRGRRRAAYVRHRVWSVAARMVQIHLALPFLARKELRQRRVGKHFASMSQRMVKIVNIQAWYRAQCARRSAMQHVHNRKYELKRAEIIDRMSSTWGAHICDTAVWKCMAELKRREQALQFGKRYATMVQSVIRAWGAKKAVKLLRTQKARREKRRNDAACCIQAMVRGYQQRGEVIRRAVYVVQEAARLRWIQRSSTLPGGGVDVLRKLGKGMIKNPPTMMQYKLEETPSDARNSNQNTRDCLIGYQPALIKYEIEETKSEAGSDILLNKKCRQRKEENHMLWRELTGYDGPDFGDELYSDEDEDSLDESHSPRYW